MIKELNIPSMSPVELQAYLYQIGRAWSGQGSAMELGCWLGATSVPLLMGLKEAGYDRRFWAFDRWKANEQQVQLTKHSIKLRLNEDVLPRYLANVVPVYSNVTTVKGNMPGTLNAYGDGAIEICIFDAPKQDPVFIDCARELIPRFIPGVTVWGLLDYKFYLRQSDRRREAMRAPVRFMEQYGDHFEMIKEWGHRETAAVFFRYIKELKL